ncbi:hypothetical protein JXA40_12685 [bacterium]|nr:hypothetical protein [candidate division CSSED10-310 bacterium]
MMSAVILLCLTGAVSCIHTLNSEFVSDDFVLADMSRTVDISKLFTANWLGEHRAGGFYRPITALFWKADRMMHGDHPSGYHLTNCLLHLGVILLISRLIYRVQENGWIALSAGILFALHPVHSEAVAWISGRTSLVAAFFYLLSLNLVLPVFRRDRAGNWYAWGALAAGFLAMLSKEIACTLPFMVIAVDCLTRTRSGSTRPTGWMHISFFSVLTLCLFLRWSALGTVLGGYGVDKHLRLDGMILSYLQHYFNWLIVPFGIGVQRGSRAWDSLLTGFLILSILILFSRRYRAAGWWFWISVLPVLNICRPQYLYLPSAGYVWALTLLVWGAEFKSKPALEKMARFLMFLILAVPMAFATVDANRQWQLTGWIGSGVRDILLKTHPEPGGSARFVFVNPPINTQIPIGLFQNGLTEALRLWYKEPGLRGIKVHRIEDVSRSKDDIVIFFDGGKIHDLSNRPIPFTGETTLTDVDRTFRLTRLNPGKIISGIGNPVHGITVYSQLSNAAWIPDGTNVARLNAIMETGDEIVETLRAGDHTSEWAIDRADLSGKTAHRRAPIAYTILQGTPGKPPVLNHTYRSHFFWETRHALKELRLSFLIQESGPNGELPELEIRSVRGIVNLE